MSVARTLVSLGRKARNDAKIGVRQPLPRAIALLGRDVTLRDDVVQEIADELNVKRFEVVTSLEGLLSYRVVPNFRALGPRVGKALPRVKELLATIDGAAVRRAFDESGHFDLDVDGQTVTLGPDDVEIRAEQHEELALAQDGPHAVALDLTLDDDLRAEGAAREFSRVLNDLRKAKGFEISDRIRVRYGSDRRRPHGGHRPSPRLDRGRSARDHARAVPRAPPEERRARERRRRADPDRAEPRRLRD